MNGIGEGAPPLHGTAAAWAEWLRLMKWDWWATPTFATAASDVLAESAVREWLARVGEQVYAAVAVERGHHLERTHAHVLVGGIGAHPAGVHRLAARWRWGQIQLAPYDPTLDPRGQSVSGACAYVSKHSDVIIVGRLRRWRPRMRTYPVQEGHS